MPRDFLLELKNRLASGLLPRHALALRWAWRKINGRATLDLGLSKQTEHIALHAAANDGPAPGISSQAHGNQIVMLVVSDLRVDPRVEREARALAGDGFDVVVLCPDPTSGQVSDLHIDWGPSVTVRFLPTSAGAFIQNFPSYLASDLFDEAITYRPFAFHGHDLATCYAALAAARITGAHFVADFHEWYSENVHWDTAKNAWTPFPHDWKLALRALEARCLKEASGVVTVCDSIADSMATELGDGRRATVIRNIPALKLDPSKPYPPLKQQLGLPDDQFVLLWQGGTGPTRMIEPIIEALEHAPKCTFVIRGPSLDLFGDSYRKIAERAGASDRLILLPPVTSRDVVAAARGADAGIWTLPNLCRNFSLALPNKIFEYLASGLPVLVADYPEASKIAIGLGAGLTFDPYDPRSIATAINQLIDQPHLAAQLRAQAPKALAALDASNEWNKLVELYRALPVTSPATAQNG